MNEIKKECFSKKYPCAFVVWTYSLILLAGAINVYGIKILSCTVGHHTGNFSWIAIHIYNHEIPFPFIVVVLSFFLGSVTSGIILSNNKAGNEKPYNIILIGGGIVLSIMEMMHLDQWLLCAVPFWLGVQNAMFVTYQQVVVRTTHMTGALTDAGFALGSYLRGNTGEIWKVQFYILSILVFVAGGYVGGFLIEYSVLPLSIVGGMYSVIGIWYMKMVEFPFDEWLRWLFTLEVTPYEGIVWIFKDREEIG